MTTNNEQRALGDAVDRLTERHPDVAADEIRRQVDETHEEFDGAPVRDFVPILVEHQVDETLRTQDSETPT
ncbi:three-helix bundle dimerization domain-containing protein [Luteimicrobium subarcticum]|uniref:CUE domain-containing protein n=1 Tax=Luteimicrobium subarcticum TaxID=620910 RepID=A0A2M8WUC2_9MICO|nr:hypothetical protein [Luteimicrobium subarcticum]PJI94514.1 hypothetical protein CLV34_0354 [Luteimicrobium subarcticum]